MFQKDKWPFIPESLSEIFNGVSTLTVVEAGCCERIQRALTLIDVNARKQTLSSVNSVNPRQRFERFCSTLRDDKLAHGGEDACKRCDIVQAEKTLASFRETGEPYREYLCHMNLIDAAYVIKVYGFPRPFC